MARKIQSVGIIGAMQPEIELLKSALHNLQEKKHGAFKFYTGTLFDKSVVLCQSGIGKVNATIATTLLIQNFKPDVLINTGSAGAIAPNIKIGDVIVGAQIAHHDVDVTAFGYQYGQVPQMSARFACDKELLDHTKNSAFSLGKVTVHQGLIVSGDSFINHRNKIQTIRQHFPDALAVEMEAAAIAQTCVQFHKPFVIIRAISDGADQQAHISFDEFLQIASRHSAQMVQQIVKNF